MSLFAIVITASVGSPAQRSAATWQPPSPPSGMRTPLGLSRFRWPTRRLRPGTFPLGTTTGCRCDHLQELSVYRPDKEPPGYLALLESKPPEIAFDPAKLKTEEAGPEPENLSSKRQSSSNLPGRLWNLDTLPGTSGTGYGFTRDGILPFMRYVIREKGKVELGTLSCAMCHSRVMPDGSVIKGAQGNFPDDRAFAYETRLGAAQATDKDSLSGIFGDSCEGAMPPRGCRVI